MDFEKTYEKKRKDFGRWCAFDDLEPNVKTIESDAALRAEFVPQQVMKIVIDNIPSYSETMVNTAKVKTVHRGMSHVEGGWPKEIDATEAQDTAKWRKRLEKDMQFTATVKKLCADVKKCIEQNNCIDLFEHYFHEEDQENLVETLSMKTIALFKDQFEEKRSITRLAWHPEGGSKVGGCYANLRFQRGSDDTPPVSYIWDLNERNSPMFELKTTSPIISMAFQNKNPDMVACGCYNGVVQIYDLRKGGQDRTTSVLTRSVVDKAKVEDTHYDPVYDVFFLNSKTGTEFATCSSDGRVIFWDMRKGPSAGEPLIAGSTLEHAPVTLTDGARENPKTVGACSMEWMQDAGPTKFLCGTEMGTVIQLTRRPKKGTDLDWYGVEERNMGFGRHFGPVVSIKRNPLQPRFFATVGDWCCKIWSEAGRGPMFQTPFYPTHLSACAWSPTRAGVLYLARQDGRLDVWDYLYTQNETTLTQKVSDVPLTALAMRQAPAGGDILAVGDADGTISLLKLCDGLIYGASSEKGAIEKIFSREADREKELEQLRKTQGQAKKRGQKEEVDAADIDEADLQAREKNFVGEVGLVGDGVLGR